MAQPVGYYVLLTSITFLRLWKDIPQRNLDT
jgi:hypothetical protein